MMAGVRSAASAAFGVVMTLATPLIIVGLIGLVLVPLFWLADITVGRTVFFSGIGIILATGIAFSLLKVGVWPRD